MRLAGLAMCVALTCPASVLPRLPIEGFVLGCGELVPAVVLNPVINKARIGHGTGHAAGKALAHDRFSFRRPAAGAALPGPGWIG